MQKPKATKPARPAHLQRVAEAANPTPGVETAFAACRAMRFATAQAERHGGDYSLNDFIAAHRLATDALRQAGRLH